MYIDKIEGICEKCRDKDKEMIDNINYIEFGIPYPTIKYDTCIRINGYRTDLCKQHLIEEICKN